MRTANRIDNNFHLAGNCLDCTFLLINLINRKYSSCKYTPRTIPFPFPFPRLLLLNRTESNQCLILVIALLGEIWAVVCRSICIISYYTKRLGLEDPGGTLHWLQGTDTALLVLAVTHVNVSPDKLDFKRKKPIIGKLYMNVTQLDVLIYFIMTN